MESEREKLKDRERERESGESGTELERGRNEETEVDTRIIGIKAERWGEKDKRREGEGKLKERKIWTDR